MTEDPLLETTNSAITLVKEWRKGGDLPYRLMGVPISLLAILSLARQERPSDLVSEYLIYAGAESLGQWFGPEAPPIIAHSAPAAQQALVGVLIVLLLWMVVAPTSREMQEKAPAGSYSFRMLASRAPVTFWLILLLAAQQGAGPAFLQCVRRVVGGFVVGAPAFTFAVAMVILIVRLLRPSSHVGSHPRPSYALPKCLATATLLTASTILFAPFGIPLLVTMWMFEWESQNFKDARREWIREELENTPAPTGSVRKPLP